MTYNIAKQKTKKKNYIFPLVHYYFVHSIPGALYTVSFVHFASMAV